MTTRTKKWPFAVIASMVVVVVIVMASMLGRGRFPDLAKTEKILAKEGLHRYTAEPEDALLAERRVRKLRFVRRASTPNQMYVDLYVPLSGTRVVALTTEITVVKNGPSILSVSYQDDPDMYGVAESNHDLEFTGISAIRRLVHSEFDIGSYAKGDWETWWKRGAGDADVWIAKPQGFVIERRTMADSEARTVYYIRVFSRDWTRR